ncbi:MAG: hypothetical protein R2795_26400 [Saprospiraceae bacterium]
MWEMGVQGGYFFVAGEIDHEPGYAYGIHIRKATDYLFSLRLDAMMGNVSGKMVMIFWMYDASWLSFLAVLAFLVLMVFDSIDPGRNPTSTYWQVSVQIPTHLIIEHPV